MKMIVDWERDVGGRTLTGILCDALEGLGNTLEGIVGCEFDGSSCDVLCDGEVIARAEYSQQMVEVFEGMNPDYLCEERLFMDEDFLVIHAEAILQEALPRLAYQLFHNERFSVTLLHIPYAPFEWDTESQEARPFLEQAEAELREILGLFERS